MKPPMSVAFAIVPNPGRPPSPDGDVRLAERQRRVPRDPLVEDVPRREPEPRLEHRDDAGCKQEQPEAERHRAAAAAPADDRMCAYSPNGLIGFGLVETTTLFVSR